ncbi:leukotriene B4 receptor 1 [Tiliqua scincoides]|uniref:leukotriene B4 receptor 1 n=1 Tax=Tiliqua scincoides TaxID=71010 RepID=UPI003461DAEF
MNATNETQNTTLGLPPLPGAKLGQAVLLLAFILGFPGNAFVVWSAACRVRKRTVTCLLILHLAIADLMVLLTAPIYLRFLSAGRWEMGDFVCRACNYVCGISMYASVFLIALMSLDRGLAVVKPVISQKVRTRKITRLLVLAIWVSGILLAIPVFIYRRVLRKQGRDMCDFHYPILPRDLMFHKLFETITGFVLPFVVIIYSYGAISQRLKETRFRQKRRTSRLISLIVVAFALFWLPYHVVNVLDVATLWSGSQSVKMAAMKARPTLIAFAFFSSSVNPILYAFSGGSFIRSAGFGFMAKLFEGTASEMSSVRPGTSRDHQRHLDARLQPLENGSLTMSTNPDSDKPQEMRDLTSALKSP